MGIELSIYSWLDGLVDNEPEEIQIFLFLYGNMGAV